jgi:hypothetical protein
MFPPALGVPIPSMLEVNANLDWATSENPVVHDRETLTAPTRLSSAASPKRDDAAVELRLRSEL